MIPLLACYSTSGRDRFNACVTPVTSGLAELQRNDGSEEADAHALLFSSVAVNIVPLTQVA
jgi:hypothetical protein